jgi:hypothetical protein
MAQSKKEYEALDEFQDLAKKITDKYPDIFFDVEIDEVRAVAITNKQRPQTRDNLWEIMPVKQPVRMDCKYGWYVVVHLSDWDALDERQKKLLVANALCALPEGDDKEGKTVPPDYKDYGLMLRTFGVDYLTNDDSPDILSTDVDWKNL